MNPAATTKRRKPSVKPTVADATEPSKVTTVRIPPGLKTGIRLLETAVGLKRPLNK